MKTQILVLMAGLSLTGCGKLMFKTPGGTVITFEPSLPSVVATVHADVASCPSGMTLVPASTGASAYCMDNTGNGVNVTHLAASAACTTQAKSVCSISQLIRACALGMTPPGPNYWSNETSGFGNSAYAMVMQGSNCSAGSWNTDLNTTLKWNYYCCSR